MSEEQVRYYYLKKGDKIQEGDEYKYSSRGWSAIDKTWPVTGHEAEKKLIRRLIHPPEGYRFLEDHEIPKPRKDKLYTLNLNGSCGWKTVRFTTDTVGQTTTNPRIVAYARKVESQHKEDTDKMNGYSEMAGYRLLKPHETIKKGDEYRYPTKKQGWHKVGFSIGDQASLSTTRRKVRMQSPGWRYLDEGEQLLVTDEYREFESEDIWIEMPKLSRLEYGTVHKSSDEYYRRKYTNEPTFKPIEIKINLSKIDNGAVDRMKEALAMPKKPEMVLCGCGHHHYPEGSDPYAAHRIWAQKNVRTKEMFGSVVKATNGKDYAEPVVSMQEQHGEEFEV